MKKITAIILMILLFSQTGIAFAENPGLGLRTNTRIATKSSAREQVRTQNQTNIDANLQQRAKTEITRRLSFLNGLLTKINSLKKISDSDKLALKTEIQSQIDGLNALQIKINSDTDTAVLKADVKSIISGYYIFAFFRVKIELLVAAERMSATADNFNIIYTKLQIRVTDAKTQGKDTASLEAALADMQIKINDAKAQYQAVETQLGGLNAQGFPGNKSTLLDARSKIKAGAQDLRNAYQDILKIREDLGDSGQLRIKSGTESAGKKMNK